MKRAVFISLLAAIAAFASSCASEPMDGATPRASQSLAVRLSVEDIATDNPAPATRGTLPAEEGEKEINSLYLFFYEYLPDGTGRFVKRVTPPGAPRMVGLCEIAFDDESSTAENAIKASKDYVILALANVEDFLHGQTLAGFLSIMQNLTEKQAVEQISVAVGSADADETDDTHAIDRRKLLMSARVVRLKADTEVAVKLTRGVVRFDVYLEENPQTLGYSLESVSIWGAASGEAVWYDRMTTTPARTKRFYGMKKGEHEGGFTGEEIVGGLYALENFVASPKQNDQVTTCLIIGIKKNNVVSYYRVNVSQSEASQNLVRNHVYKVRIHDVPEGGADNEYNAWSQSRSLLTVSINAWNVDDNGMVLTDGVNTMVMPVKLVRLDPKGDVREYSIHTIGSASLSISKKSLPGPENNPYIRAELVGGTLLRITAEAIPMGDDAEERRGSIELSYGDLRGSISFVQTPDESLFLELSRYEIPNHLPIGNGGIPDNVPLTVTASGPWTATIYNTDTTDPNNPGFSFSPSDAKATTLRSASNPFGNAFQIYTTGDNPSAEYTRSGFVMVTLDESPVVYSRVVALTQEAKTEITFTPALPTTLRFTSLGTPSGRSGAAASEGYVFEMTNDTPNGWTVTSTHPDAQYFEVVKTEVPLNRFVIKAKGIDPQGNPLSAPYNTYQPHQNLFTRAVSAVFTINLNGSSGEGIQFTATQDAMGLTVTTYDTEVPAAGGKIRGVTVNSSGLQWTASITDQSPVNAAYLMVGDTNYGETIDAGQDANAKLVVGFPKLYFPNTGVSPSVTVTVALAVNPAVTASFTVTQQELDPTAAPLNVLDVRNAAWGSLTWASDHYLTRYREYLNSPQLFGPTGKVKTGRVTISGPTAGASFSGAIPDSYAYVHAGGQPAHYSQSVHNAVNEWFDAYGKERLLVYVVDNALANPFKNGTLKTVLSQKGVGYKTTNGAPRISTTASSTTKLYQYIMVDGPFGAVPTTDLTNVGWYWDAVSSTADGLNGNMIKLLEDAGGNAYLFIDPENNLMFLGESNIFDLTQATAAVMAGGADKIADVKLRQRSVFLANLQAWMLNAAQYGTGWTDMFLLPGTAAYDRVTEKAGKTPVQLYDAAKEKNAFRQ